MGMMQIYRDIFGTDNPDELRAIARKARAYDEQGRTVPIKNKREAGRKQRFIETERIALLECYHQGESITSLAERFQVSRQTIYKYLEADRRFERDPYIMMRLEYLHQETVCTIIDVDFFHKKIYIQNRTNDILHRAFGVIEEPDWEMFEDFLESRCFPPTRAYVNEILEGLGITDYDPLQIIEKTGGHMAEDQQWIRIRYREEVLNEWM